jgi:hypothetical protein
MAYPDGPILVTAVAVDAIGNEASKSITVNVNNEGEGSIAGVCQMSSRPAGPLVNAAVTAYKFEGGVIGNALGTNTEITCDERS